jgi:hypothetical protein
MSLGFLAVTTAWSRQLYDGSLNGMRGSFRARFVVFLQRRELSARRARLSKSIIAHRNARAEDQMSAEEVSVTMSI